MTLNKRTGFVFYLIKNRSVFCVGHRTSNWKGHEDSGLWFRKALKGFLYNVDLHGTSELISKLLFINGLSILSKNFHWKKKENIGVQNNYSCISDNEFCSKYGRNFYTMLREIMPVYYIKLRVRCMKTTKQASSYVRNNTISNVHNMLPFVSRPNQPTVNRNAKERQQIKKLKA
jgi:hypothetical protein